MIKSKSSTLVNLYLIKKLGLTRILVYNSVFNVNRRINQFLYSGTVLDDDDDALAEPLISNNNNNTDSKRTSVLN